MPIRLLLILLAILPLRAAAQPTGPDPCDTCYTGYRPDTAFVLGAIDVGADLVDIARDSLGLDLVIFYNGPTAIDSASTNPAVLRMRTALAATRRRGMQIAFPPILFGELIRGSALAIDNYPGYDPDSLQAFDLHYRSARGFPDTTLRARHHVWGWSDTTRDGRSDYMAGRPRYTSLVLGGASGSHYALLESLRPGRHGDSSRYFRMAYTVGLPSTDTRVADTTVVAWGVVLARDTARPAEASECACANYLPIDTLMITRRMIDRGEDAGDGYVDIPTRYISLDELPSLAAGAGNASTSDRCRRLCAELARERGAVEERADDGNVVEGSAHLVYRFHTAGRMPIRFLRGRLTTHMFELLRGGDLDTLISREIDAIYSQPLFAGRLRWLGLVDEPDLQSFRAMGLVSAGIQRALARHDPESPLPLYSIHYGNYNSLRHFTGDLDTTRVRLVQRIVVDHYINGDDPVPVTYANPDSMDARVLHSWYRVSDSLDRGRVVRKKMILGTYAPDYAQYLMNLQHNELGSVADLRSGNTTVRGPWVPNLARAVDVARRRYPGSGPAPSVYSAVGIHGFLDAIYSGWSPIGYTGTFFIRPPTPEEITVQCWLALGCGVQGIIFSHLNYDGLSFGVVRHDGSHDSDYDTLALPHRPQDTTFHIPRIWTGFRSRFAAVRRVAEEMRRLAPVYERLEHRGEQISVFDTRRSLGTIPILDSVATEMADVSGRDFVESRMFDRREETYLEVTLLHPDPAVEPGTSYLLLTNRRCWPIDFNRYGDGRWGYGNIDVRRPWIALADSGEFVVERVGHESEGSRRMRGGTLSPLDWLEPGWGALYRIKRVGERGRG